MGKIIVAGIGPGSKEDITPAVLEAVQQADCVVGYKYYFQFVEAYVKDGCECIDTGMKKERERAEEAFRLAEQGKTVVVISSGDAGLYGMVPLIYQMKKEHQSDVSIEVLPGISAFQKAASLLGAPIGHDLCIISLSDLMTPWEVIERRIKCAADGDFVTAIYNPKSHGRYWQLYRLVELFLKVRSAETPVGYVRQAGREEQEVKLTTLGAFDPEDVDMFTVILIGNSQSYIADGKMITPRGYRLTEGSVDTQVIGQQIMTESFRTIKSELRKQDYPLDHLWALLHAIHTTADFDMQRILYTDEGAVETLYNKVKDGTLKTIVTDVTMVNERFRDMRFHVITVRAKHQNKLIVVDCRHNRTGQFLPEVNHQLCHLRRQQKDCLFFVLRRAAERSIKSRVYSCDFALIFRIPRKKRRLCFVLRKIVRYNPKIRSERFLIGEDEPRALHVDFHCLPFARLRRIDIRAPEGNPAVRAFHQVFASEHVSDGYETGLLYVAALQTFFAIIVEAARKSGRRLLHNGVLIGHFEAAAKYFISDERSHEHAAENPLPYPVLIEIVPGLELIRFC